jgi:hypothetical protein
VPVGSDPLLFLSYVALKYTAYAAWCFLGLRWLRGITPLLSSALGLGLLRLFLGIFFGVAIFLIGAMMHLNVPNHPWLSYFAAYVPVRWVEWSIMTLLVAPGSGFFMVKANSKSNLWKLGGIAVSFFADLPLILSGSGVTDMLPVGRFLC